MPSSEKFREILKEDGYVYVVTSKDTEPIHINFPNLPEWYEDDLEYHRELLPQSTVICFEYKTLNYKLLVNTGNPDCNNGVFGALFDEQRENT